MTYAYAGSVKNEPLPETCGDKVGTVAGFARHCRANESPCDDCRAARNAYVTRWRASRPKGAAAVTGQRLRQRALLALKDRHPEEYRALLDAEWINHAEAVS